MYNVILLVTGLFDSQHDLLKVISVSDDDLATQYFDEGLDGFPAYVLRPSSNERTPYRQLLSDILYGEFSLHVVVKPASEQGGFLFAVVDGREAVVQMGVSLSPADPDRTNISLFYTDLARHSTSQIVASFAVLQFAGQWTRFVLGVADDGVTLYLDCREVARVAVKREPRELVFDTASTLYIGQAGPVVGGHFDVSSTSLLAHSASGCLSLLHTLATVST
ncbi:hypothetical protein PR048_032852 [Dryococelus australis]|uniref:Thrombospondin-like N-terminal domain-containing protein n=1 Tax=Dryococelus australis TaxID=614101 RepID=A0ABQ9G3D8_9NEOP|nr:hypothetical protein PR048_032852 [Dryococelus australis]